MKFNIFLFSMMFTLSFQFVKGQEGNNKFSAPVVYKPAKQVSYQDFIKELEQNFSTTNFIQKQVVETINGYKHYKLQQNFHGLKMLGSEYNVHVKDGLVTSANGQIHDVVMDQNRSTEIGMNEIKRHINMYIEARFYDPIKNKVSAFEIQHIKILEKVISDVDYPKYSGHYTKAAVVQVSLSQPYDQRLIVLDLYNGNIIHDQSLVCAFAVEGKGRTKYYGEQTFIVDSLGPDQFQLKDPIRNITTYSAKTGDNLPYYDEDNYWEQTNENLDEVALDAHYCTSKFHDMMVDLFDYRGMDGSGKAMDPVVHVAGGAAYLNAFWDGSNAYFGNGDCHHNPLTTLSVVGHEFMHGVTDYTSDLIYANESGAINESMSDIFGKSLEYFYDNERFSWELGPEFGKNEFSRNFRDMSNPNLYEDPALYLGMYWDLGGGVHTNSGVFNYWFYLMVDGGQGENENGDSYNVVAQPIEDVLQVVWLCQTSYLTPSSTYPELYEYSLEAVDALFGNSSEMMNSVVQAWKAVGLPYTESAISLDLAVEARVESTSTCYQDHPYTIEYSIYNLGNTIVEKGQGLEIRFNSNSGLDTTVTLILDNDFLPSEKLDLEYNNAYIINDDRIYFYNINLITEDSIPANNFAFGFLRNFTEPLPTMELLNTNTRFEECFSNDAELEFSIFNKSCGIIPAGTQFAIELDNNLNVVFTQTYTINQAMNPNSRVTFTEIIEDLEVYDDLGIKIVNSDINFYPGRSRMDPVTKKTISGEYMNTFDDDSFREDMTIYNQSGPMTYSYDNDEYFAALGTNRGRNRIPCPELTENLDEVTFGKVRVLGCIDLSMLENPVLNFDLVQFRYEDSAYEVFEENTAIVRISYTNENSSYSDIIHNQTEGQVISHTYPLPSNFRGELYLEFFSHFGNNDSTALNFDANLMDNFQLTEGPTRVEDPEVSAELRIIPNPASDWIRVEALLEIQQVQIFNSNGRLVIETDRDVIDLSAVNAGIYFIKVMDDRGRIVNSRFVKGL